MGKALDNELNDVAKHVAQAQASVAGEDWLRAAQALLEVQDRVGRVLREIELCRNGAVADGKAKRRRGEEGLP